jgi:hypothetical protein
MPPEVKGGAIGIDTGRALDAVATGGVGAQATFAVPLNFIAVQWRFASVELAAGE